MPDQPLPPASNLRILTLNVGLLRLRLFGVQVFSNPPYVLQRLEEIPKTIRELRPDVVCLQECYEQSHLEKIKESLSDMLPHAARYIHPCQSVLPSIFSPTQQSLRVSLTQSWQEPFRCRAFRRDTCQLW
mmetsp:Transcript_11868/g.29736  ORF Transcript_11868/g.29736 Transcript_11868/m.29736 type:complete len:130 (-) Transcript_11868:874-1263(-)